MYLNLNLQEHQGTQLAQKVQVLDVRLILDKVTFDIISLKRECVA